MKRASAEPYGLKFEVTTDFEELSRRAAEIAVTELKRQADLILCASAGGSPTGMYAQMVSIGSHQPELFRQMRILQVDEWGGIPADSPVTCAADLQAKLARPLHIPAKRYVGFKADASDPEAECQRISKWLAGNGPIGLCILGLGLNGHVAMNEPGDALAPHAHVSKLSPGSQQHSMLANLTSKPRYGLSLGVADILASRKILLLVSGKHKRAVLKRLLERRVTTQFPASFLWLHPDTTVLCDHDAAPGLKIVQ